MTDTAVDEIIRDPVSVVDALKQKAHPRIPLPRNLYGEERLNSRGVNLADPAELDALLKGIRQASAAAVARQPDRGRQAASRRRASPSRIPQIAPK